MHGNHHSLILEMFVTVLFTVLSWAGNAVSLHQLDAAYFEPILHLTQWAAAIIAMAVGSVALYEKFIKKKN